MTVAMLLALAGMTVKPVVVVAEPAVALVVVVVVADGVAVAVHPLGKVPVSVCVPTFSSKYTSFSLPLPTTFPAG